MAATAVPLLPFDVWPAGITQAATPANNNALRAEVIARPAISFQSSQPSLSSPSDDGSLYVLSAAWGEEVTGTLAFFTDGTWYYFVPYEGMLKHVGGVPQEYVSGAWQPQSSVGNVLVPVQVAVSDETSNLTTGANKIRFRMPFAMTLTAVRASVSTAPTGANLVVDINVTGVGSILSTPISIDAGETTSTTAATPAVISVPSLADDAEVTVDIDQVGSTAAGAGLKVSLIGYKTP